MRLPKFASKLLAITAMTLLIGTPAQAGLQDRDLNGDGVTDAFYDTDLNITWLRNANVNGLMTWAAANTWAAGLSIGVYSGWRLPTSDTCSEFNCTASETGHLIYTELGNSAFWLSNPGGFQNLRSDNYWTSTEQAANSTNAWYFLVGDNRQNAVDKSATMYAMAVRPGDVAPVPEPEIYATLLAGLGLVGVMSRRRTTKRCVEI